MSQGRSISLLILSQHSSSATTGISNVLVVMRVPCLNFEHYCSQLAPKLQPGLTRGLTVHWVNSYFWVVSLQWIKSFTQRAGLLREFLRGSVLLVFVFFILNSCKSQLRTPSAPVWTELSFVCRWACLRSTQRYQSPCRWRPKPSSCAALSQTRTGVPPP